MDRSRRDLAGRNHDRERGNQETLGFHPAKAAGAPCCRFQMGIEPDRQVHPRQAGKGRLTPSSPKPTASTLLRRASLDLIGLPPTVAEVDAFLNDKSPNAYEKQVDRLLASPHYGERWGRIWLDAARYADSDGYEKDKPR